MVKGNYSYPIDPSWSTAEIETVIKMLNVVEKAYEGGVARQTILQAYREFKSIVPAKSEEKQLGRDFYHKSGYQLYDVVKAARTSNRKTIQLSGEDQKNARRNR